VVIDAYDSKFAYLAKITPDKDTAFKWAYRSADSDSAMVVGLSRSGKVIAPQIFRLRYEWFNCGEDLGKFYGIIDKYFAENRQTLRMAELLKTKDKDGLEMMDAFIYPTIGSRVEEGKNPWY
jgi:hypothetical protein